MTDPSDLINRGDRNSPLVDPMTESWLSRVKSGDDDAWRQLTAKHAPLIVSSCRKSNVAPQDIEDVVQDVFSALYKSLVTYEPGNFIGYLVRIAKCRIADYWRNRSNEIASLGGSDNQRFLENIAHVSSQSSDSGDARVNRRAFRSAVELVRSEFAQRDWTAFVNYAVEEKSPAEVAEALGMTRNQVYLARSRILSRLRKALADQPDGPEIEG